MLHLLARCTCTTARAWSLATITPSGFFSIPPIEKPIDPDVDTHVSSGANEGWLAGSTSDSGGGTGSNAQAITSTALPCVWHGDRT